GRYSGVFTDIIYDHFLALDKQYFNPESLAKFAQNTYHTLKLYEPVFPEDFKNTFFYMEKYDWLSGYQNVKNIDRSFQGIYHRAKFLPESEEAFHAFKLHYQELKHYYNIFMPEMIAFALDYYNHSSKQFLSKNGI
ncbi:MAG: ACP phosphodiesterase, partial [Chitinophagaceae bacterium]